MSDQSPLSPLPDRQSIKSVRERVVGTNAERLKRLQSTLSPKELMVLRVLPCLIHVNHPDLPGYLRAETPAGISHFSPGRDQAQATQDAFRGFSFFGVRIPRQDITGVYLVGMAATAAQAAAVDWNVWVCHRPDLAQVEVDELKRKLALITEWAAEQGVALRLQVINPAGFRRWSAADTEADCRYSPSQLDAFYRFHLVLAGQWPLWWLIAPAQESQHDRWRDLMLAPNVLEHQDYCDFGPVAVISRLDLASQALLTVDSTLIRPHAAVIDLIFLEWLIAEPAGAVAYSTVYKQIMHSGKFTLDMIDPYVMQFSKVADYLNKKGDARRLELVRRCFYLNVSDRQTADTEKTWRTHLADAMRKHWGWAPERARQMDSRRKWSLSQFRDDWNEVMYELSYSVRYMTAILSRASEDWLLPPETVTMIGRKLRVVSERKGGKVECMVPPPGVSFHQRALSLHCVVDGAQCYWMLYAGYVHGSESREHEPVRKAASVIDLMAWAWFNQVMTRKTDLHVEVRGTELSARAVKLFAEALMENFSGGWCLPVDEVFNASPSASAVLLFVNVGVEALAEASRDGSVVITEQNDPLSYGAVRHSLVRSIDMVVLTTWGEVHCHRFDGGASLVEALVQCIRHCGPDYAAPMPAIVVKCESGSRGDMIIDRVNETVREVLECYRGRGAFAVLQRYLIEIEQRFYLFQIRESQPAVRVTGSVQDVMAMLAEPQPGYGAVTLDRGALLRHPLREVLRHGQPGRLQVFFQRYGSSVSVFVHDEWGCVHHVQRPFHDETSLLRPLHGFLMAVAARRHEAQPRLKASLSSPIYAELVMSGQEFRVERRQIPEDAVVTPFLDVQAIVESTDGGEVAYRIYCGNREFSSLELGNRLHFEVARYIASQRRSQSRYPFYITDLDISMLLAGAGRPISTCDFLRHKESLETAINAALGSLSPVSA